jgi:methylated-DNA-[protein]-cysteine S-methyltransferase
MEMRTGYFTVRFPLGKVVVHSDDGIFPRRVFFDLANGYPESHSLSPLARSLERYLAGEKEPLDGPVDLGQAPSFTRRALECARTIPYGTVVTYGDMAAILGSKGAARAVGRAMGSNPLPLFIPCHRVVARGGKLGGFSSGIELKRWLLDLEGADV